MKKIIYIILALLVLIVISSDSYAKIHKNKDVKIEFDVPDKWKFDSDDNKMTISAPENAVSIVITIIQSKDLDPALQQVKIILSKLFSTSTLSEPMEANFNSMGGYELEGIAEKEGNKLILYSALLWTPTGDMISLIYYGVPEMVGQNKKDFDKFKQSIKPLNHNFSK